MIQVTELEAKLFDRIRNMSIVEQNRLLQLIDNSVPETIKETPETAVEEAETEMSSLERRQRLVEIMKRFAARGGVMMGVDVVEWQREERKDRPLPGRED